MRARDKGSQYLTRVRGSGSTQAGDGTLATASSYPLPKDGSSSLQDAVQSLPGKSRVIPATETTDEISSTTRDLHRLHSRARARGAIPLEVVSGVSSQHDVRLCTFTVPVIAMPSESRCCCTACLACVPGVGGTRHPWRELAPQAERCARGAAIAIPPV